MGGRMWSWGDNRSWRGANGLVIGEAKCLVKGAGHGHGGEMPDHGGQDMVTGGKWPGHGGQDIVGAGHGHGDNMAEGGMSMDMAMGGGKDIVMRGAGQREAHAYVLCLYLLPPEAYNNHSLDCSTYARIHVCICAI